MLPLTLLAATKVANILSAGSAYSNAIAMAAQENQINIPAIGANEILLSSAGPDLADNINQFSYPRLCLYSSAVKNNHLEKFRSLSASIMVIGEVWSSGNFLSDTDSWVHYYVDAFTSLVGSNIGDWGDGIYFPGTFEVQFQQPKRGGFGFTQMAKIICNLTVSR